MEEHVDRIKNSINLPNANIGLKLLLVRTLWREDNNTRSGHFTPKLSEGEREKKWREIGLSFHASVAGVRDHDERALVIVQWIQRCESWCLRSNVGNINNLSFFLTLSSFSWKEKYTFLQTYQSKGNYYFTYYSSSTILSCHEKICEEFLKKAEQLN